MIQIKLLKDWKSKKAGEIINISKKGGEQFVQIGAGEYVEPLKKEISSEEQNSFKTYEEAQKHFNSIPDLAKVLSVEFPKNSGKYKPLAFFKPEITLKEQKDFEATLNEETKNNTAFFPKPKEEINLDDFLIISYNKKGEEIDRKVNIDAVAEYIENKFKIRTIFGIKEETIEVYQEGVWSVKGRGIIKAEIERLLFSYAKNNVVNEILEKIKRRTETSREETEKIPDFKRCLKNGVLDFENIEEIKLLPCSKEYNFRTKWNINFNPEARCERFLKLINECFDEEDILKFQEWIGFHLVKPYIFKKFAIFYGAKDTSKSVLVNWLTIFLNGNISGLSLHEISRGKAFDLLILKDKDANICDDLSSEDMSATGGIKMSVGDGFINGEQKFGDKIRFRNTAKHTYTCNKIPSPKEDLDDIAYYGRILLFCLSNVIPKKEQDQNLIKKITTPEELSGALNWAIEGYKRLISQNGFSFEKDPEEIKYLMIKGGNSLAEFCSEVLFETAGNKITKDDLYNIYCNWCSKHKPKLSPDTKEKIGRNLTKFIPFAQSSKSGSERYWLNLKLRDTWDTFLKNMSNFCNRGNSSKYDCQNNIYNFSESVPSAPKNEITFSELDEVFSK